MDERAGATPSARVHTTNAGELGRVLRARYLPALVVVALLAVAGHLALARVLSLQDDGAAAVNVSGRQRMLSQRIALHLVLLRTDPENEGAHREELDRLIELMQRSQRALLLGDAELGLSATDSDEVLELLRGPEGLDARVETFLGAARELAREPDPTSEDAVRRSDELVAEARGPLLEELDAVVGAFQRDVEADLGLMWLVSVGLMVGTLATVAIEWRVVFRPLTRRLGLTTEQLELADTDVVTGLWSRRRFLAELRSLLEEHPGPTLWVLYCDLDGFKGVNDTYGHDAGDEVLRSFAERLVTVLPPDAIAGRVGGDEFVVAVRRDRSEVEALAAAIVSSTRRPFAITGAEAEVGTSVGIAAARREGETADRLLSQADRAMYTAKRDGKGVVRLFDGDARRIGTPRASAAAELSAALAAGELGLHYRTIVEPGSARAIGVEAVVTWDERDRTQREIVDLAIGSGLDPVVASFAIEEVRAQLSALAAVPGVAELVLDLTTNVLLDAATVQRLRSLIDDAHRVGLRLGIDIVEHPTAVRDQRYLPVVRELRERGLTVAVEGFGTGPASLIHLGSLPLDVVKVDLAAVTETLGEPHTEVALRGLVEVARSLDVDVVVDDVADPAALDRLADIGCRGAQGPAVSPPMSLDDLVTSLASR